MAKFKRGDYGVEDEARSGRPPEVTTPENIEAVHELILKDRRISITSIEIELNISYARVQNIIHAELGMKKLSAKWVLKCLMHSQRNTGETERPGLHTAESPAVFARFSTLRLPPIHKTKKTPEREHI